MTLQQIINKIANAIERQEGYRDAHGVCCASSRAYRNNNPGNIWDGLIPGQKDKRIWPHYAIDPEGFLRLPSYTAGRALMEGQLVLKIRRGETLTKLINEWDSGDKAADRAIYVDHAHQWTGLPVDVPLEGLVGAVEKADKETVLTPKETRMVAGIVANYISEQGSIYNDPLEAEAENALRVKLGLDDKHSITIPKREGSA